MLPLDGNFAHVSVVRGGKGHEGECDLINLSITLHRFQFCHEVTEETFSHLTKEDFNFQRKGLK